MTITRVWKLAGTKWKTDWSRDLRSGFGSPDRVWDIYRKYAGALSHAEIAVFRGGLAGVKGCLTVRISFGLNGQSDQSNQSNQTDQ